MTGHDHIIAMRRRGHLPATISVSDYECLPVVTRGWMVPAYTGAILYAHVALTPGENIERLDLRFAVGMTVMVDGEDGARLDRLATCLLASGAARVLLHDLSTNRLEDLRATPCM